jgi:hypothetical protein
MDTAPSWRPLGEVIVERGLVTQDQLEDALLEQRITHKRLGTILVDRGFVSAQDLTDALVDQIGVEDLLDEFDRTEGADRESQGRFSGVSRLGGRLVPFRREDDEEQHELEPVTYPLVPPLEPVPAPEPQPEVVPEHEPDPQPTLVAVPDPEPKVEAAPEPEPQAIEEPAVVELEPIPEPAPAPAAGAPSSPHAWLGDIRAALTAAELDFADLSARIAARTHELDDARAALAAEAAAHRLAEEEIARLHSAIDQRDVGFTQLERTVEDARAERAAVDAELAGVRLQRDRTSQELAQARQELAEREAKLAELETFADDLKQLRAQLDQHAASTAQLTRHAQSLQAELQAVVAERDQLQHQLGSRERRVAELEATPGGIREKHEAVPHAAEPEPKPVEEPKAVETPVPAERPAAQQATGTGFLYFVPRENEGFELVEHDGAPPEPSVWVELEGRRYEVKRHGRSPLAFDKRTCVYLRISAG